MKNKNLVVRPLTIITAILSFIFFRRLQSHKLRSSIKHLKSMETNPQFPHAEKILLESAEFSIEKTDSSPISNDDFKIIRGIGAKSERALHNAGIQTFSQLSTLTQTQIETILRDAGVKIIRCEGWQDACRDLIR